MPQVTVYVRLEDLEQWKAIEKKSDFLAKALKDLRENPTVTYRVTPAIHTTSTSITYSFNPKKDKRK